MYYYKDSSKNIIYVKSKESLINLISQNIINQNTEIRIGLRGSFIEAKEIEDLQDLFHMKKLLILILMQMMKKLKIKMRLKSKIT